MLSNVKSRVSVVFLALSMLAHQAVAAVPAAVTTAIGETKTDAIEVAVGIIGIVFGLLVFKYIRGQAK